MKLSKHNLNNDQPKTLSKRDDKKSVNIKWNSKIFFQLGLIISLLVVYTVMQTKFEFKEKALLKTPIDFLEEPPLINYTIEEPKKIEKKKVIKTQSKTKAKVLDVVVKIDDDSKAENNTLNYNESETPIEDDSKNEINIKKTSEGNKITNILGVEHVPVFPGCDRFVSNLEKRNCMSLQIRKFIQKRFNTDKFDDQNSSGEQTITVQFYIDEKGNVSEIKARAADKSLEKEAIRVVSKLPQMKPGRQGENVVKVQYMLPIVFRIN